MDNSSDLPLSDINSLQISSEISPNLPDSGTEDEGFGSFEEAELVEDQIDTEETSEIRSLEVDVDEFMRPKQPLAKSAHTLTHPEVTYLSSQMFEKVQISTNILKDYEIKSNKSLLNCVKGERDSRMFQKEMRMKQLYLDYAIHLHSFQNHDKTSEQSISRFEITNKYGVSQLAFSNLPSFSTASFDMKEIGEHLTTICDHFCSDVWTTLYLKQVAFNYAAINKRPEPSFLVSPTSTTSSEISDFNAQIPEIDSSVLPSPSCIEGIAESEDVNNKSDTSMSWANNIDWLIS